MPSASSSKSLHAALDTGLETKVAGITIDALGRKWDPSKHPRDSRGRFIETGGIARVGLGGLGKVVRSMIGGKVEVEMQGTGEHKIVPHQQLTMVRRPDGSKPTASVKKVAAEDAKREEHPGRGDGKFDRDTNPDLQIPDEDPQDEDDDNPFDGEPDDAGVPDAYTPSREEPREGDIVALTARDGKSGQLAHIFAKVDTVKNGEPDQITLADKRRTRTNMATVKSAVSKNGSKVEDHTILPFEDLKDPAALMTDAEDDNGKFAVLDNELATDLVEGHAKVTAPKPRGAQGDRKPGGGRNEADIARPVAKDDLGMGRKVGTVTIGGPNGRIVGRIEKDPEHPGRWKVTDRWGRTKVVGQKWDTGRTALANMLNNPPKAKGDQKPAVPAAPQAPEQHDVVPNAPEVAVPAAPKVERDYADEYRQARLRARSADTLAERGQHEDESRKIARAAEKAGVKIDEVDLDEEARQLMLAGEKPRDQHTAAPAAPEAPAKVEAATKDTAAKQARALNRVKTTDDSTANQSKSGNLLAIKQAKGYAIYRRTNKPKDERLTHSVTVGEHDYEHVGDSATLEEFRLAWVGGKEDHAPTEPNLLDTPAQAPAPRLPEGAAPQKPKDSVPATDHNTMAMLMGAGTRGMSREERDAHNQQVAENFERSSNEHAERNRADFPEGTRVRTTGGGNHTGTVVGHTDQFGDPKVKLDGSDKVIVTRGLERIDSEAPAEDVPDLTRLEKEPVGNLTDDELAQIADADGFGNPARANAAYDEIDRRAKGEEKPAAAQNPRLPEGAAPQKPKAERPSTTPTPDYAESDSHEGATTHDAADVRADRGEPLASVPAEGVRGDDSAGADRPVQSSGDAGARAGVGDVAGDRRGGQSRRDDAGEAAPAADSAADRDGRGRAGDSAGRPGAGDGDGQRGSDGRGSAAGVEGELPGRVAADLGDDQGDDEPTDEPVEDVAEHAALAGIRPQPHPGGHRFQPQSQADLAPKTPKQKARANIEALRTLATLNDEDRAATPEEQAVLARWSGWGSLGQEMFSDNPTHVKDYAAERAAMYDLMTPAQIKAARRNTLNAHYTDAAMAQAMWDGMSAFGFDGDGTVLEPGSGAGTFMGFAPKDTQMVGVELDPITAAISQYLYPDAIVENTGLQDWNMPDGMFDATIGNVPFAKVSPFDREVNPTRAHTLHNFAILKAIRKTKPGGLVMVMTSNHTMDSKNDKSRRAMYADADLVGAVRLPAEAHKAAAGTSVVTDVLVFRKRKEGEEPGDASWLGSRTIGEAPDGKAIYASDYFLNHPENVLGQMGVARDLGVHGLRSEHELSVKGNPETAGPDLRAALTRIAAQGRARGIEFDADRSDDHESVRDVIASRVPDAHEGQITHDGEKFWMVEGGRRVELPVAKSRQAKMKRLLELRDVALDLLNEDASTSGADESPRSRQLRKQLNDLYDKYLTYTKGRPINDSEWVNSSPVDTYFKNDAGEATPRRGVAAEDLKPFDIVRLPGFDAKGNPRRGVVQKDEETGGVALNSNGTIDVQVIGAARAADRIDTISGGGTFDVLGEREPRMRFARKTPKELSNDPVAEALLSALESYDPETNTAVKGSIFSEKQLRRRERPTNVSDPDDALRLALDSRGDFDIADVAQIMGTDAETARKALGTRAFTDPATGKLVPAEKYLSGDVRAKLAAAEAAAVKNPEEYAANVAALNERVPEWLDQTRIKARLGASWIEPETVAQFIRTITGNQGVQVERLYGSRWVIDSKESGSEIRANQIVSGEWGTPDRSAYDILDSLLHRKTIRVTRTIDDGMGGKKTVLDKEATEAAQARAEKMDERFKSWLWEDPDRAEQLLNFYNENFNGLVKTEYSDAPLEVEGMSETFELYPHQAAGVRRVTNEPATLLAHEVGAGKTLTIAASAMELRRLGLAQKPAIVVPNHMKEQWQREFLTAFPQAKVLAIGPDDIDSADGKQRFYARLATGDWDAVILTEGAFKGISVTRETEEAYIEKQLSEMRQAVAAAARLAAKDPNDSAAEKTVKDLERQLANREEKLRDKLDKRTPSVVPWESTGIDYLFVDEAHRFKNLERLSRTAESLEGSDKASDLDMKLGYLRDNSTSGRFVTFATATPIANSLGEMHTVLKYMRPDLLEDADINDFDTFLANFAQERVEFEMTPDGGGWAPKERLASFYNMPGLLRMWQQFADVMTSDDLDLDTPDIDGGRPELVLVPSSDWLRHEYTPHLIERAESSKGQRAEKGTDNILVINGDGKAAALHPGMVGGPAEAGSGKIGAVAQKAAEIYEETKDNVYLDPKTKQVHPRRGGFQILFLDQGTPGAEGRYKDRILKGEEPVGDTVGFEAYETLKQELIAQGIPAEKIAFIHDAKDDAKKARLFEKCRTGEIAILVGSTEKMGVGTNIQDRAVALHNIDCPYRPADIQQRIGRAERQKNQNSTIRVLNYATEGSLDTRLWDGQERKARLIAQIMRGDLTQDEVEDVSATVLSAAEMKAAASGNETLLNKVRVEKDLNKALAAKRDHLQSEANAIATRDRQIVALRNAKRTVEMIDNVLPTLERNDDPEASVGFTYAIGEKGKKFAKRTEANAAWLEEVTAAAQGMGMEDGEVRSIGKFGGLEVTAQRKWNPLKGGSEVEVSIPDLPNAIWTWDKSELSKNIDFLTRFDNQFAQLEQQRDKAKAVIPQHERNIENAKAQLGKEFTGDDLIDALRARRDRLVNRIKWEAGTDRPEGVPMPEDLKNDAPEVNELLGELSDGPAKKVERPAPVSLTNLTPEGKPVERTNAHLRRKAARQKANAESAKTDGEGGQRAASTPRGDKPSNPSAGKRIGDPDYRVTESGMVQVFETVHGREAGQTRDRVLFNVQKDEQGWGAFKPGAEEADRYFGDRDAAVDWALKATNGGRKPRRADSPDVVRKPSTGTRTRSGSTSEPSTATDGDTMTIAPADLPSLDDAGNGGSDTPTMPTAAAADEPEQPGTPETPSADEDTLTVAPADLPTVDDVAPAETATEEIRRTPSPAEQAAQQDATDAAVAGDGPAEWINGHDLKPGDRVVLAGKPATITEVRGDSDGYKKVTLDTVTDDGEPHTRTISVDKSMRFARMQDDAPVAPVASEEHAADGVTREELDTARQDAVETAAAEGATPEEAEQAGQIAAANAATADADVAGERPTPPAPPAPPAGDADQPDGDQPDSGSLYSRPDVQEYMASLAKRDGDMVDPGAVQPGDVVIDPTQTPVEVAEVTTSDDGITITGNRYFGTPEAGNLRWGETSFTIPAGGKVRRTKQATTPTAAPESDTDAPVDDEFVDDTITVAPEDLPSVDDEELLAAADNTAEDESAAPEGSYDGEEPAPTIVPEGPTAPVETTARVEDIPQYTPVPEDYEPRTPTKLDDEDYPLNEYQQVMADDAVIDKTDVVASAKAGTGKTSTAVAIAKRKLLLSPEENGGYLAFNKSVRLEAVDRMPKNVEALTGHGAPFRWKGEEYTDARFRKGLIESEQVAKFLGIPDEEMTDIGDQARQAWLVQHAVGRYSLSADDEIGLQHFSTPDGESLIESASDEDKARLLGWAQKAWADIAADNGQLYVDNDHIRKMWALARPDFSQPGWGFKKPLHFVFLDEAQDTPPVLARVMADQTIQRIILGDSDQAIYGSFTGSVDYMKSIVPSSGGRELRRRPLPKSYRYGENIADAGNRPLQIAGSPERVIGAGSTPGEIVPAGSMSDADAILVRSNGGMLGQALSEIEAADGDRIIGVPKGTRGNLQALIETVRFLRDAGPRPRQLHEDFARYSTWKQFEDAAEKGDDPRAAMLMRILEQRSLGEIQGIVDKMVELRNKGEGIGEHPDLEKIRLSAVPDDSSRRWISGDFQANQAIRKDPNYSGMKDYLWQKGIRSVKFGEVPGAGVYSKGKRKGQPIVGVMFDAADEDKVAQALRDFYNEPEPKTPDVIISTVHKAKGLEWDNVKAGDDFPQPRVEVDDVTGEERVIFPSDEELRIAYVAFTRAAKKLDPGSLAYVFDYTDPNGGDPNAKRPAPADETITVAPEDLPSFEDDEEDGDGFDVEDETPAQRADGDIVVPREDRDPQPGETTRFYDGMNVSLAHPETGERIRGKIARIKHGQGEYILDISNRDTGDKWTVAVPHGTPINAYSDVPHAAQYRLSSLTNNDKGRLERQAEDLQHIIDGNLLDPAGSDNDVEVARERLAAVNAELEARKVPLFTNEPVAGAKRDGNGFLLQRSNEVAHSDAPIAGRRLWIEHLAEGADKDTRLDVVAASGREYKNVRPVVVREDGYNLPKLLDNDGNDVGFDPDDGIVEAYVVAGHLNMPGHDFMSPADIPEGTRVQYSRDGKKRVGILEKREDGYYVIGDPAPRANKRQGIEKGDRAEHKIEESRFGTPLVPMWRIDSNDEADEKERERRKRRRDSRRRYDPNPNGNDNNNGGMGGLGGAPLGAGFPLEDLPLDGGPRPSGSGSGSEDGSRPDGGRRDRTPAEHLAATGDAADMTDDQLAESRDALERLIAEAEATGQEHSVIALQSRLDAVNDEAAERRARSFPSNTAGSLQVGDEVMLDGSRFRIEDISEWGGDRGRRFQMMPTGRGSGFPIGRIESWSDDQPIERAEPEAAPEAPAAPVVDGFDPANRESDASAQWIRENWNDGNPHRKPALGKIVLSPALATELRMIDWDSREADGVDPGYTWGPQDRFITIHDKTQALSAFDNLADILKDQASGGDRGKASIARAAEVRATKVRELPDDAPETRQGTVASGEQIAPDQLLVGDAVEGVLGSTGDRGNLRVESVRPDGTMDLITGVNDKGERDTIRIPSGYTVTRFGTRADDGTRESAWGRTPEQAPAGASETGMLSLSDIGEGDVIHGKAGGITGRWQLVRRLPNNNPLFEKWAVVPEGRPDATPQHINLSKNRPVKVVKRAEFVPPATDENGFEPGELREGDVPATQADLDNLFGRDTDTPDVTDAVQAADAPEAPAAPEVPVADVAEGETDVRPEPLVNGNLRAPYGTLLPADSHDGSYSPESIDYMSQYGGGDVVINVGDQWHVGKFEGVRDGQYVFRPTNSLGENDVLTIDPDTLDEVRSVSAAEAPGAPVPPESLRPGTRVAFTRDRKLRVGVLEGVTPEGRAQVRDIEGTVHETVIGGQVRPVFGAYKDGHEPTEAAFAPRPGVWTPAGDGWATGSEGEWTAGIKPTDGGFRWQIEGAPMSGVTTAGGTEPTVEAAQAQVIDALYQQAGNGAQVTTLPGRSEEERDAASAELRDTIAALRGETETPETPEDASPETAAAPDDIDGAQAGWVPTGELQPGDVARVDGDNGNGSAETRTGHVLGTPETNEVHTPTGGKPDKATRTPIGPDREGFGDRETLLSAEESVSARVERPDEYGDADTPADAAESRVLSDHIGDTLPTDRDGVGVYPGSVVEDHRGRQGVVSEVWDLDAAVRWSGKDSDERVRPGTLKVVQQNRASGWTPEGRKVAADQIVTLDGEQGRVVSVSGDDVEVEIGGEHRTVTAGEVKVVGTIADNPSDPDDGPTLDPTFTAPPSVEGLDIRPTAPVKPDALPEGTEQVRPNYNDDDRALIGQLGIDIDATSPYNVQQAAARIRHGMALSNEQAADLSAWLGALLGSKGVPAGKARGVKRLRNRLDAALQRAGGPGEPRPAVGAPEVTTAAELVRGDMVAVPNPVTGEATVGTVRGIWPIQNGQVALVTVEHADGEWSTHRLNPDGEVFRLPDLDSLDNAPEPEAPVNEVAEDAPFTQPRVSERLQDAAQSVVDAVVGDEAPESLEQLAADVENGLDSGEVERGQRNASGRLETSLEGAGVSEDSAAAAHTAAEEAADEVADEVADTVRRTVADAEPLPGESDADAAKRVHDRLREAADEVAYDEAAQAAIDRAVAEADGDFTVPPTAGEQAHAQREITDALRNDLFSLADQLAAMGDAENAQALSDVAARLAGRPDEAHVQRAVAAASMGRGPGKVRSLARRIRGMFARQRARFLERVRSIMDTAAKAKRSWKAAVSAARAEWNGDNPEVAGLVADAAKHLTKGGDPDLGDVASVEPQAFADRVRFWGEQLPDDTGMFGRTERTRRGFRGLTLDGLRAGRNVTAQDLTGSVLDRAADGGPGDTALGHHAAVSGIGAAVRDEVTARARGMLPEFGDDPAGYVRDAFEHADRVAVEERDNLNDDELAVLRRKARDEAKLAATMYANARAEALTAVLSDLRPVGPQGAAGLQVQGRDGKAPEVEAMRWAEKRLPTDWLASAGTVEVKAGRMGSYDGDGEITVAPLTDGLVEGAGQYGASAVHGLAHHLETVVPGLAEAGWVHHWVKTSNGTPGSRDRRGRNGLAWFADLFPGVGFTKDDGAARATTFQGAEFDAGHYEWVPTALSMILAGADDSQLDDDLEQFMLGLLAWLGRPGRNR